MKNPIFGPVLASLIFASLLSPSHSAHAGLACASPVAEITSATLTTPGGLPLPVVLDLCRDRVMLTVNVHICNPPGTTPHGTRMIITLPDGCSAPSYTPRSGVTFSPSGNILGFQM